MAEIQVDDIPSNSTGGVIDAMEVLENNEEEDPIKDCYLNVKGLDPNV